MYYPAHCAAVNNMSPHYHLSHIRHITQVGIQDPTQSQARRLPICLQIKRHDHWQCFLMTNWKLTQLVWCTEDIHINIHNDSQNNIETKLCSVLYGRLQTLTAGLAINFRPQNSKLLKQFWRSKVKLKCDHNLTTSRSTVTYEHRSAEKKSGDLSHPSTPLRIRPLKSSLGVWGAL